MTVQSDPHPHPSLPRLLGSAVLTGIAIAAFLDVVLLIAALAAASGRMEAPFTGFFLLLSALGLVVGALCGVAGWLLSLPALLLTVRFSGARAATLGIAAFLGYAGAFLGALVVLFGGLQTPLIELPVGAVYGVLGAVAVLGAWNRGSTLAFLRPRRAHS